VGIRVFSSLISPFCSCSVIFLKLSFTSFPSAINGWG
jgi:hypothetical protein